ncbi:6950_t:CDS:2 [Paraglomus occultum]|uniref:6950_t:CDS:1 n=1 Tax=Paraglomus occultum TaxID=144539 RepID=A0A9N8Z1U6_9GLOM|nr:6950_t:CDS:2 [Paraglomus occultum]
MSFTEETPSDSYQPEDTSYVHHQQRALKILAIGTAYEDTILYVEKFPPEDGKQRAQKVEKRRGGNAGNTLTILSQFPNFQSYFMASMASEEASNFLINDFEKHGIQTSACIFRQNAFHSPVAYIIQAEETSSRTIINYNSIEELTSAEFGEKFDELCDGETMSSLIGDVPFHWIHFEGRNVEETAKMMDYVDTKPWRSRTVVSVELEKPHRHGLEHLMRRADVIFFSKVFAEGKGYDHPGDFLTVMAPACKSTAYLFCTWGDAGASCFHNPTQRLFTAPALPITRVVDTVGAGDTFIAGVIYGLSLGVAPESVLRFACELAGHKCLQIGFDEEMRGETKRRHRRQRRRYQEEDENFVIESDKVRDAENGRGAVDVKKKGRKRIVGVYDDINGDKDYMEDISHSPHSTPRVSSKRWTFKSFLHRNSNSSLSEKIFQKWLPFRDKESIKSESSSRRRADKGKSRAKDVPNDSESQNSNDMNGMDDYNSHGKSFQDAAHVYDDGGEYQSEEDSFESCAEDEHGYISAGETHYYENAEI